MARITTHLSTFPVELIDHTVDFLHDDVQSLWSCTSVSRAFLRSARSHLFHNLYIGDEVSKHGGRDYTHFLNFLQRTPEVHSYVRHLKLGRRHPNDGSCQPEVCWHVVGEILSYLPYLHTFAFGKGVLVACSCTDASLACRPSPGTALRLKTLSLDSAGVAAPQDLCALLRVFSGVHTLTVTNLFVLRVAPAFFRCGVMENPSKRDQTPTDSLKVRLDVQSLVLDTAHARDPNAFELVSCLLGYLNSHALRSITFGFDQQRQIKPFGALIARSAEVIEHLTLQLPAHPHAEFAGEYVDTSEVAPVLTTRRSPSG